MERHDRQLDVLRAIVQDYVRSREPVGSRNLVERYNLGVSPATLRSWFVGRPYPTARGTSHFRPLLKPACIDPTTLSFSNLIEDTRPGACR